MLKGAKVINRRLFREERICTFVVLSCLRSSLISARFIRVLSHTIRSKQMFACASKRTSQFYSDHIRAFHLQSNGRNKVGMFIILSSSKYQGDIFLFSRFAKHPMVAATNICRQLLNVQYVWAYANDPVWQIDSRKWRAHALLPQILR